MDYKRNKQLFLLLGKRLVDAAAKIAGDHRIRFSAVQQAGCLINPEHSGAKNRQLFLLLGKEKVDAAVDIAGNDRILFSAIRHAGRLIEMEEALAENKHPDDIAKQLGMDESTVRAHRDGKHRKKKR